MKNYSFTINGQKFDVQVKDFEDNFAEVEVNGTNYKVEVHTKVREVKKTPTLVRKPVETTPEERKIQRASSGSSYSLISPLPGSVFKILVNIGDKVSKGQTLLVMEAMKMENNIQTEKDGIVREIKVKVGDTVLQNDTLIVID